VRGAEVRLRRWTKTDRALAWSAARRRAQRAPPNLKRGNRTGIDTGSAGKRARMPRTGGARWACWRCGWTFLCCWLATMTTYVHQTDGAPALAHRKGTSYKIAYHMTDLLPARARRPSLPARGGRATRLRTCTHTRAWERAPCPLRPLCAQPRACAQTAVASSVPASAPGSCRDPTPRLCSRRRRCWRCGSPH
jgi:hypothetical protein